MPVMLFLCDWVLACDCETYRYPLPHPHSCHSFSHVHLRFSLHVGLGHCPVRLTITTPASYPSTSHSTSLEFFFSIPESTIQRESRLYRYIFLFRVSTLHTLQVDTSTIHLDSSRTPLILVVQSIATSRPACRRSVIAKSSLVINRLFFRDVWEVDGVAPL